MTIRNGPSRINIAKDHQGRQVISDTDTGDILKDSYLAVKQTKGVQFKRDYFSMFQDLTVAKSGMSGKEFAVFHYCLAKMDWYNYIEISQKDIAAELGIGQKHVSTLLKKIVEKGLLERDSASLRSSKYRVNISNCFKGSALSYEHHCKQIRMHVVPRSS